jgi:xanthine dehydrogenase YagR molybdenum-binding subunit
MAKKKTTYEVDGIFHEAVVEVPENEPKPWGPEADLAVLGKPMARVDGPDKVSGRAKYTLDINLPRMLWAKILRCPHAHARIVSIDTRRAEALPGIKAVLTHKNAPDMPWPFHGNDAKLFNTTLRYPGEEVAVVAATDEHTAADALALINVEYEELPFVLDAEKALEADAPKVRGDSNLLRGQPSTYTRGEVDKGLAEADFVVEQTFRSQVQVHACLETHVSVAQWSGDKLTVWDSTQATHGVREQLAQVLGLPIANVRVITQYSGGGFGSKLWLNKHTVLAALLARQTGRPVKLALDREEDAMTMGNRPSNVMTIKAGCKRDGTLTALYLKSVGPVGAYPAGAGCGAPLREIYACPNVKTEEYNVFIHADQARPHRAPGHVQGTFALEQVIDMLAEKCGLDPLEFRRKNYSLVEQTRNNIPYSAKGLERAYAEGATKFGWAERHARKRQFSRGAKRRGCGMATQIWYGGGGPPGYAIVKINFDGTANLLCGAQDIGTATRTSFLQITAEELGMNPDQVTVAMGDTETCPYGPGSGGSRTVPSMAPAVRMAAADAKRQMLDLAARVMKIPAERLAVREGRIFDTANPATRLPLRDVTSKMRTEWESPQSQIIGVGFRGPNPDNVSLNTWGAQFAEVEVDTDTGEVRVLRIVAAHECGRVINPLTATSQIEGGVIQGIGFALFEQRVLNNATGRMVNANLRDYKLPSAPDIPEIEAVLVDLPDPAANSVAAKGLGEPPIIPTPGAIANAIYDAIGTRVTETPMTPDRVLRALGKAPPPKARARRTPSPTAPQEVTYA